ncbi:hypothetical protein XA68_14439 [Ophiocordyceps unilateralis]|uniref:6-phosphogluconolactonase n=1 Tax=Ophiocordyceps unilateralis TaxID=268505 RepID=A0A2A9PAE4_OPHUN|nr:hypothetical protein XA68_14439 [Ophiocordyceps unilateralis]
MPKTQPNLFAFPDVDALAPALRSYILQSQAAAFDRHGTFKVAVSGGSLPKTLAAALLTPSESPLTSPVDWSRWEIFFADERAVPLDDAESNYALLKTELLDRLPKDTALPAVHPIDVALLDDGVQALADAYEKTLVASFASRDSVRLPIFDLILLGCGPDGHTCSLFPGHSLLREADAWVAPIDDSPKPPPRRITLTLPVVTHAIRAAFVATGSSKRDIMKKIFDSPDDQLPCNLVNAAAGDRCSWFVDEAAVDGVAFPRKAFL